MCLILNSTVFDHAVRFCWQRRLPGFVGGCWQATWPEVYQTHLTVRASYVSLTMYCMQYGRLELLRRCDSWLHFQKIHCQKI